MKPIVLLAFANDPDRPLNTLSKEQENIQNRLQKASHEGLCELKVIERADIDNILQVFQKYPDRIAVFHFAGHAGSYELCLQSADGRSEIAHAGGFAEFLSLQRGLQLVFLNGCSTQKQVEGLLKAKVGAVIATSQAINDEVATYFSSNFYLSLGSGDGIHKSFQEAAATVKMKIGDSEQYRGIYYKKKTKKIDRFPWDFYLPEGAEIIKEWNLPDAAGNPLFGLPNLPEQKLPEKPFRYLRWFRPEDAEIFYGRGYQIRDLYKKIMDPNTPEIIHLYGRSGVGKSSLLAAGLFPRLQADHDVLYIRRSQETGLLSSLATALGTAATADQLMLYWLAKEQKGGRPVTIIMDQVEEVFTRPLNIAEKENGSQDELDAFILFCKKTNRSGQEPHGKLILSYRKEYLAEIENRFIEAKIAYDKLFLQNLQHNDIIAAVTGLANNPTSRIREKYQLEVEKELPAVIADDLLEDRDSPIAPVLQILLSKMWDETALSNSKHTFTVTAYQKLRKEGLLLGDFLQQKLDDLKTWNTKAVDSGLVLGLLLLHTTAKGTAARRSLEEINKRYPQHVDLLPGLLVELKNRYLLVEVAREGEDHAYDLSLAHDTLAPLLLEMSQLSDFPAQKAHRVLTNKMADWQPGDIGNALDSADLKVVEEGQWGMRNWMPEEIKLIAASRERRAKARRTRRRIITGAIIAVALIIVAAIVAIIQRQNAVRQSEIAEDRRIEAEQQTLRAEQQTRKALSKSLTAYSNQYNQTDPTTSFRTAEYALQFDSSNAEGYAALLKAFYANPFPFDGKWHGGAFYEEASQEFPPPVYNARQYLLHRIEFYEEGSIPEGEYLVDGESRVRRLMEGKKSVVHYDYYTLAKAVYSPKKRFVLLFFFPDVDYAAYRVEVWDLQNEYTDQPLYGEFLNYSQIYGFTTANFSYDDRFVVVPRDNQAQVLNLHYDSYNMEEIELGFTLSSSSAQVLQTWFSKSGHLVSTLDSRGDTTTFNLNNLPLPTLSYSEKTDLYSDLSGKYVLAVQGKSAQVWDIEGQALGKATLNKEGNGFASAPESIPGWQDMQLTRFLSKAHFGDAFSIERESNVIAKSKDGNLTMNGNTITDAEGQTILTLSGHASNIFSVDISPDNQLFLTSTCPKGGLPETKLWDKEGNEMLTLAKFGGKAGFLPGGKAFYTYLANCCAECWYGQNVKIWPIDQELLVDWVSKRNIHQLTQTEMDRFGIVLDLLPTPETTFQQKETATTNLESPKKQARITGSNVNVRSAPQVAAGNIIGQLDKNNLATILDFKQGDTVKNGFVSTKATILYLADGTEVTLGNGKAVERLGVQDSGNRFEVQVEIDGKPYKGIVQAVDLRPMEGEKWYQVQSGDLTGWVYGQFVEEI